MTASKILAVALTAMVTWSAAAAKPLSSGQSVKETYARPLRLPSARLAGNAGATINGSTMRPRSAPALINGVTRRRPRS
jgi:hypothetical protein